MNPFDLPDIQKDGSRKLSRYLPGNSAEEEKKAAELGRGWAGLKDMHDRKDGSLQSSLKFIADVEQIEAYEH